MALAPMLTPLVMKNSVVEIDGTDYRRHCSAVVFTPSASAITWQGLSPDASYTDAGAASWACALTFAQDWAMPNSLCQFLFENEGETVPMTFAPVDGGPTFAAEVVIVPGAIGGTVSSVAESTVTLGCKGRPVLAGAAPTP